MYLNKQIFTHKFDIWKFKDVIYFITRGLECLELEGLEGLGGLEGLEGLEGLGGLKDLELVDL